MGEQDAGSALGKLDIVDNEGCAGVVVDAIVEPFDPLQEVRPAQARVCFDEHVKLGMRVHSVRLVCHGQELPFIQILVHRLNLGLGLYLVIVAKLFMLRLGGIGHAVERIVYCYARLFRQHDR